MQRLECERIFIDFWGNPLNDGVGIDIWRFAKIDSIDIYYFASAGSRTQLNRLTTSLGFKAASCNTLIDLFRHY